MAVVAAGAPAAPATAAGAGGGGAVRFAVKGDWGDATSAQAAVTRRICAEHRRRPFVAVLTTGDNFSRPDGVATRANFWAPERCIRRLRIPYRAAWGNHDVAGTATAEVLRSPRRYYAFSAGPARVVVLDANRPADAAQLRFLRREMRPGGRRVRIVVFHQPVYAAGFHAPDARQQRLWVPLLRRGRVALVLQGHNHAYERIERDGVTYITTGGGGARLYPCVRPTPGLRACRMAHHFVSVTVTRRAVGVRVIGARGATLERVRITPRR